MKKVSALLALLGVALLIASFLPWPAGGQEAPAGASAPAADPVAQGAALFRAKGCVSCHRHDAVAGGDSVEIGPNLTHYDADPAFLRRWLRDPAAVRPDTRMPNLQLAPAEIEALIAFLGNDERGAPEGSVPGTTALSLQAAPVNAADWSLRRTFPETSKFPGKWVTLSEQARERAREAVPDPVLRQLITGRHGTSFLFTDQAATVEVDVTVPEPGAPPEAWEVAVLSVSKLVGHTGPDLELEKLKVGPDQVAQAMAAQWPGCAVRTMTLIGEEDELVWVGFCDTPAGTVSGTMDNATGVFEPSAAPPARPPATSTPEGGAPEAAGAPALPNEPPDTCPVTRPPEQPFTPGPPYPASAPYRGKFWYGTEALWTMLPVGGRWDQLAHGEKVWWWREGYVGSEEPEPALAVTGRRLDGPAPVARSGPPATNGYHPDFHWAMLTGVTLPTPGCWEITGRYEDRALTFVVWVAP